MLTSVARVEGQRIFSELFQPTPVDPEIAIMIRETARSVATRVDVRVEEERADLKSTSAELVLEGDPTVRREAVDVAGIERVGAERSQRASARCRITAALEIEF